MTCFRQLRRWLRRSPRPLNSLDAYAIWAQSYPARAHNAFMQLEQTAMEALLPPLQGQRVLDLACGTGRYGLLAQQQGAACVIGLDNSQPMLRAGHLPLAALASVEHLPLPANGLDVILCGLAVGHLPSLGALFSEIARVLRPGGTALLSDLHPFQALQGAQRTFSAAGVVFAVEHHIHLYADYLQAAAAAGLTIDALAEPALPGRESGPVVLVIRLRRPATS